MNKGIAMKRRAVLSLGAAGLVAGGLSMIPARQAFALDNVGSAFQSVTEARRKYGLGSLAPNAALNTAAVQHAKYLARTGLPSHLDAKGHDPIRRAGLIGYAGRVLGEALAETFDGPTQTVAAWLANEETRAVLLNPQASEIGLVAMSGKGGRIWWDLMVGTQKRMLSIT